MTDKAKKFVEALRTKCSEQGDCNSCAKSDYCYYGGDYAMRNQAADLIKSLAAELEQVKRERDAAVEDLSVSRVCRICDHYGDADFISRYCSDCVSHYKWQWRGTKEG